MYRGCIAIIKAIGKNTIIVLLICGRCSPPEKDLSIPLYYVSCGKSNKLHRDKEIAMPLLLL